jgi:hypothetical protein
VLFGAMLAGLLLAGTDVGAQMVRINAPEDVQERIPSFRFDSRALHQPVNEALPDERLETPRPQHTPDWTAPVNDLPVGGLLAQPRTSFDGSWPAVDMTGWTPPDPDIAVGPNHVVEVVNSSVAWFEKSSGAKEFQQTSSTFFGNLAQTSLLFDPECFYDRVNSRFVVMFVERDVAARISNVLIAVSDDDDPNGVWHRYRFRAKLTINATEYWLDFPSIGYTQGAYVVAGNMFGFVSGFGGAQFLVIPSSPLLSGAAASAVSLRDEVGVSVQIAESVNSPGPTAFGVSRSGTSLLRVYAVRDANTTTPVVFVTTVTVPTNSAPTTDATSTNGTALDPLDGRLLNAVWRSGRIVTAHSSTPAVGAPVAVRWYELQTGNWPLTGAPVLLQAGLISAPDTHYFMPAINKNADGDIAVLFSASSGSVTADIRIAGRTESDAPGSMGTPLTVRVSDGSTYTRFRWGDRFKVEVDPLNDQRFWGVGEYVRADNQWGTEVMSWSVALSPPDVPQSLTATAVSTTQIELLWQIAAGAVSYSVERSSDDAAYVEIGSSPAGVPSYSDKGLSPNTDYFYRVRALNAAGASDYSSVARATTTVAEITPPAAPTDLTVEPVAKSAVRLSWTDHATNEAGFQIERSKDSKSWTAIATAGPNVTELIDDLVSKGKNNSWYRVRAYNAMGYSAYSNAASQKGP